MFKFVSDNEAARDGGRLASARDRELHLARIKSHAARTGHLRRKNRVVNANEASPLASLVKAQLLAYKRYNRKVRTAAGQNLRYVGRIQTWQEDLWPMFQQLPLYANAAYCHALKVRPAINEHFFQFMQDEAMFHIGAAYLHFEHHCLTRPDQRLPQLIHSHMVNGLRIIRKRLTQAVFVDNATLLAILLIPFCEECCQETINYTVLHWQALASLLQRRMQQGGIEHTPGGAYLNDVLETLQPCAEYWLGLNIPLERQPKPRTSEPTSPLSTDDLPEALRDLLEDKVIGPVTSALGLNLTELLMGQDKVEHTDLALSSLLTWRMFDIKAVSDDGQPSTELILAQALQVYCIRRLGRVGLAGVLPKSARWHMTLLLLRSHAIRSEREERAIFWAWVVTLDVWRAHTGELTGVGRALRRAQLQRFQTLAEGDLARDVLTSFYSDGDLIKCFDELVGGQVRGASRVEEEDVEVTIPGGTIALPSEQMPELDKDDTEEVLQFFWQADNAPL